MQVLSVPLLESNLWPVLGRRGRQQGRDLILIFFARSQKMDTPETVFPSEKLARLFLSKEFKPSPERKMIKLLTFINLFPPLHAILTKTRNRMTMAIAFSLQNDADS